MHKPSLQNWKISFVGRTIFLVQTTAQPFAQPLFSPFINGTFPTFQVTSMTHKTSVFLIYLKQVNHSLREVLKASIVIPYQVHG